MKKVYLEQLRIGREGDSDSQKLNYFSSIIRSLLQTLAISSFEIVSALTNSIEDDIRIKSLLDRFEHPSDGLPVEALELLIPIIRGYVSKNYMLGWFEASPKFTHPLCAALSEWVSFRNKRPAHGVVDDSTAISWAKRLSDLIEVLLSIFGSALPKILANGTLVAEVGDQTVVLGTPLLVGGDAIVVSGVVSKKGIWKLRAQTLSREESKELTIDLDQDNIFAFKSPTFEKFRLTEIPGGGVVPSVFNNIPARQTTTFVGREKELDKLTSWLDDVVDGRMCLIFGDGGFGKTTLALEFFNNLLDGKLKNSKSFPSLVSFYTAKKTKWTDEGLVHFKGISDAMEDSVRELLHFFYPVLGKEWYKIDGSRLIDKIANEFSEQGFTRNDILLIIDNTETLATSANDAEELAEFLTMVGKKLGRVVITSRRHERFAATPVAVSSLSEAESLQLIQRLGKEYNAQSVINAGERRLRAACAQLMHKPLLIDTLVRYISRSSSGIQEGLDQILKKTSDQLLEFLYEDAWARMNELVQEVFMVLVSLATPLEGNCVGDVCREVGVQHAEFQSSLSETYFASIIDNGNSYDLEIVELAKEFFRQKKIRAPSAEAERFENIAFKVDKLSAERNEIERNYKSDRVADAYRSEYAKAAKIATIKRDNKGAREYFELALLEEPLNAALRERYASFLLRSLGRADEAYEYARHATELDTKSGDAWLTLALIQYSLNRLEDGDFSIEQARKNGKHESLCALRQGIARYHHVQKDPDGKSAMKLLLEAQSLISRSSRVADPKDFYYAKNISTAEKYAVLINSLIKNVKKRLLKVRDKNEL